MAINGKRYDWEDITITLPQGAAVNITDISYSDGQAIAVRYGKGGVPRGYGRQNYEASGSMTIDLEEWERLSKGLGDTVYDHEPFSITVSYADSGAGTITDKLNKVKITKLSTSNSQGGENAGAKSVEFTVLEPISYNGKLGKKGE
jgi:hypothetical protein